MDTAIRQNNIASRHVPCIYLQFHMYPICACALHHCMCLTSMHNALHVCTCITSMYCALSKGMCLASMFFSSIYTCILHLCLCIASMQTLHPCICFASEPFPCIYACVLHLCICLTFMNMHCKYAYALQSHFHCICA